MSHPNRPTFWMLPTTLVALLALFLGAANRHPIIPIGAVVIAAAYWIKWRMPTTLVPWLLRAGLFTLIVMTSPESRLAARFWYQDPNIVSMIAICLEVEMAIQHFLPYTGRIRLGQMLAIASLIFAAGTLTYDSRSISVLAPIFTICLLGVLRSFRPAQTPSPAMSTPSPVRTSRRWLLHGSTLVLALTMGFAGANAMHYAYFSMGARGFEFLRSLLPTRTYGGISGNEQLRSSFNPGASTNRTLKIHGTTRAMHLRGLVFDRYYYGQWRPVFEKRTLLPPAPFELPAGRKTFRVDRLQDSLDLMYLPLNTPGFATPPGCTNQMEQGHLQVIVSVTESGEPLSYTAALPPPDERLQGPLCRPPTDEERLQCLHVPAEIEPGVRAIAKSIHLDDPRQQIQRIIQYLQDNHKYSLEYVQKDSRDPVSAFLTDKADAHCQFFAASAVMLMRLNGIPCRYITGYFAHEATGSDEMVVRGRDAHAWAEAYLTGVGWITVEATPASGTPAANDPVSLYQRLKDWISDLFSAIGGFFRALKWHHIATAGGVVLAMALALQALRAWRQRRKVPGIRAYSFPTEEYRQLAVEFEMTLRKMGDPPSGAATWGEHLLEQTAQTRRTGRQQQLDSARRFVEAYNEARFGDPESLQRLVELRGLLEEVKET